MDDLLFFHLLAELRAIEAETGDNEARHYQYARTDKEQRAALSELRRDVAKARQALAQRERVVGS